MNKDENKQDGRIKAAHTTNVLERNISALVNRQIEEEKQKAFEERVAEAIGRFTGNIAFVYIHAAIFGVWILWNGGWLGLKPFDKSFNWLQIITAIEAIFLTTFVLMSQNSLDKQADKRSELDLQISLLSEHEITRMISLLTAIAKKMDIQEARDPEINELSEDVVPEKLMDTLEKEKRKRIDEAGI